MRSRSRPAVDVTREFDAGARRYDLMVALNPGYHRHLRAAARTLVVTLPARARVVDLGCGSGASTRALLRASRRRRPGARRLEVVGVDASGGMLAAARAKRWPAQVRFAQLPVQQLPTRRDELGLPGGVDGVFAAYLLRNVPERDEALAAVAALLRPGGWFVTQEYSVAGSSRARLLWTLVCWTVVIPLGRLTSGRTPLYRYLWRSVLEFDSVEQLTDRFTGAGFVDVDAQTVGGWQRGILHTVSGRRP